MNRNDFDIQFDLFTAIAKLLRSSDFTSESASDLADSFSQSQILSKGWLVQEVNKLGLNLGHVFLCAGWYAGVVFYKDFKFKKIRNIDVNPQCKLIADELHRSLIIDDWKYLSITDDVHNIDFKSYKFQVVRKDGTICELNETPDTIINTSCEHLSNFDTWYEKIPNGKIVILQSNNGYGIDGHINCVKDLDEFSLQTPMSQILFSGENKMPKFNRFMRIGYK